MADGLKQLGFRRRGNHLHRQSDDLIHGIHFQASIFADRDHGSLTANLLITWDSIYRTMQGEPLPANPATAHFPFTARIGSLMPERCDRWWGVDPTTDLGALCQEVVDALNEFAVPYFDRLPNRQSVLAALRADSASRHFPGTHIAVLRAVVAHELGHVEEARQQFTQAIEEMSELKFEDLREKRIQGVKDLAERLNLPIA